MSTAPSENSDVIGDPTDEVEDEVQGMADLSDEGTSRPYAEADFDGVQDDLDD